MRRLSRFPAFSTRLARPRARVSLTCVLSLLTLTWPPQHAGLLLASAQTPLPPTARTTLPSEADYIQRPPAVPNPRSTDYLIVTQSKAGPDRLFNVVTRPVFAMEITGKEVLIDDSTLEG